ncbi:RNA polymerase sigma-70 factor [Flavivirga amylovorans]|uniref:RNA polymerase sigma-70 factor n=1 Tax=Flavivirga amylovorans TaxID=870486 RepID=A0ABT8X1I9_9FLAO|nr:RNA polymerase sigma-70 factor [Flavivirga amylovorans]MDO5987578.1 RNA polymerase sigma-70 factor [Flavivirga amylovorans]
MNELEAVLKLKKGEEEGFNFFFDKYYNRLVAYIVTFNNDKEKAEDIVQDAFINFWKNRAKLDPNKSPKSYLYSITLNRFIDTINKNKKEQLYLSEIWKRSLESVIEEDDFVLEKRLKKMNQILVNLPPKCKKIILLNKIEGLKYKDIAVSLGISIKTVESQMRIAFKKIREGFEEDSYFFLLFGRGFIKQSYYFKDNLPSD